MINIFKIVQLIVGGVLYSNIRFFLSKRPDADALNVAPMRNFSVRTKH